MPTQTTDDLRERIAVARGLRKADLVLRGCRVVNVFSGAIERRDVAIHRGKVAGLGHYDGKTVIDASSRIVLPGLIDSHVHLESSLLVPAEFVRAALPRGVTGVVADPHEIANVLGKKGISYFLRATSGLPLDFYFMLPSCVPASRLETSGASLTPDVLAAFLRHERVLGLAEMMNYPGVLAGDREVLRKLVRFGGRPMDGHAPGLSGRDLMAYISAGIASDHECVTAEEAREKAGLGMTVFIREGSAAKDLEALLPAVNPTNSRSFCLCTDDLQAGDLLDGAVDRMIRKAVGLGLDPVTAVRMATINPANHFCLRDKGAVAPGYDADLVVIDDFDRFTVEMVFKKGRLVARGGRVRVPVRHIDHPSTKNTVKFPAFDVSRIRLRARGDRARVIELIPRQIETRQAVLSVRSSGGFVVSDTQRDILKLLVVERHRSSGHIGFGLVKGFGLSSGALASTIAHDSHNIIAVGVDDADLHRAVVEIGRMHGGMVVVDRGKVLARLPLPVAGLMSEKPAEVVAKKMDEVRRATQRLGVSIEEPFSALSFLALPVVPELKLTDRGLVDVNRFAFVDLFV